MNKSDEQVLLQELQLLRTSLLSKEAQIKTLTQQHQTELDQIRQQVIRDQDELKQNILTFMLRDNEQSKKLEQLHINYEVLQNQLETIHAEGNQKIKSLLDIIDKKDLEIQSLKQKPKDKIYIKDTQVISNDNDLVYISELQNQVKILKNQLETSLDDNEILRKHIKSKPKQEDDQTNVIQQLKNKQKQELQQLAHHYEEQITVLKQRINNLNESNNQILGKLDKLQAENEKLLKQLDLSNHKINELVKVCEKYQKTEEFQDTIRRQLRQSEDKHQLLEKNYKMEITALQIQLDEASKFISKDTASQAALNKTQKINSDLKGENEELRKQIQQSKAQMEALQINYQEHINELRRQNTDLSQRQFELQTIIESQKHNFIEREFETKEQYDSLIRELGRLQSQYELLRQKEYDNEFRIKLLKPKPQPQLQNTLTKTKKRSLIDQEFTRENDKYNLDAQSSLVTKLNRNVYIRTD